MAGTRSCQERPRGARGARLKAAAPSFGFPAETKRQSNPPKLYVGFESEAKSGRLATPRYRPTVGACLAATLLRTARMEFLGAPRQLQGYPYACCSADASRDACANGV
jgi:hypothetical protein